MDEQNISKQIGKAALNKGLLLSGIMIVLNLVEYFVDPMIRYTNFFIPIIELVVIIVLMIVLAIDVRRSIGGYWEFKDSFRCLFIMVVVLSVFMTLFNFVMFKFVNPDMPHKIASAMEESITKRLSNAGLSQEKIDTYTKPFENGDVEKGLQPTFTNEFKALGSSIVLYIILSLILGAILIRRKPVTLINPEPEPDPTV